MILLYHYCSSCDYSNKKRVRAKSGELIQRTVVKECMTQGVTSVTETDSLFTVIETLSACRIGAILVRAEKERFSGVISKTDLILAYKHGLDPDGEAHGIMTNPLKCCLGDEPVEDAIRTMIFSDLHRLFVAQKGTDEIIGIFTLTDAARNKSGSCHACMSSRITV